MRLLVITQKIDAADDNLGFFVEWVAKLTQQADSIVFICLERGNTGQLPKNVEVLSLGKEKEGFYRLRALGRFYRYIIQYRHEYDGVFVHMNTEYVLLGGLLWRGWNKKILLWYTHKAITWQLRVVEKLVTRIFTASKESFRLKSKKVEIACHGIDLKSFAPVLGNQAYPPLTGGLRLLAVGRIAPVKDLETIIRAVAELHKQKNLPGVSLSIVGAPIVPKDKIYLNCLEDLVKNLGLSSLIHFKGSVPHKELWKEYQDSHILIHTSQTGSVDKVVLEALAAGRIVVTSSEAFADLAKEGLAHAFSEGDYQELAKTIEKIYNSGIILPNERGVKFVKENYNLDNLIKKIVSFYVI